jgi:hypothetical protein
MGEASSELAFRAQLVVPEQRQLYDYWLGCAAGKEMPARKDINPVEFPRLLPFISLIDVEHATRRFRVRLAGTRLRDIYEREITGSYLDELEWGVLADYWQSAYCRVVDASKPAQGMVRGPRESKDHLVQFWLRLPLSDDPDQVNMILCYDAFVASADADDVALMMGT